MTEQRTRTRGFSLEPFPVVTATLVAARLEEDNAIHLLIADVTRGHRRQVVSLPGTDGDAGLPVRMRAARERFVEALGQPSFEGWTLLYGTARLTLTDEGGHGLAGFPQVLGFEPFVTEDESDAA